MRITEPTRRNEPLRRTRGRSSTFGAFVLATAAIACGGNEQKARFRPIERPALTSASDAAPRVALAPWAVVEPAAGGVEIVQALRTEVLPDPGVSDSAGLLKLFHRDQKVIAVPAPPNARRLDRLRVRVAINRFDSLRVRWLRDGAQRAEATVPLFPSAHAGDYVIDVPASSDRAWDRFEIRVLGEGAAAIGRIELFELSAEHRLPYPSDAPRFVRIGDDTRPAWGLCATQPMQIAFDAPTAGILVASATIPPALRVAGDKAVLTVQVLGSPGGVRVHRYPLAEPESATTGWVPIRVPLDAPTRAARAPMTVRFLLETRSRADAACAITQPQIVGVDENAPTVLFVTSDTHRGDHVGFAQSGVGVTTPELDALAARGVVFEDAWSASNVTIPSHVSMLTGLPLRDTTIVDNVHALSPEADTLAEAFARAGWATVAAVSASHLDADWSGLGQGFDRMAVCRPNKRGAGETLAHLERWLADYRGRPLFIWLHLFDAHTPYAPPPPLDRSAWDPARDPYDPALSLPDPRIVPSHLAGIRDLEYVVAQYRGEVNYLDSELARLLDRSRFREAIVAFTADHGESFGSHGVYWDHGGLYRDRLHVPLVLSWPAAPGGTRIARRVTNIDVGRTLLDLAGLETVEYPGFNLLAPDASASASEPVHAIASYGFSASIADGDDLLILHLAEHELHSRSLDAVRKRHTIELYDVARDPECTIDTSVSRRERALELREDLVRWLRAGDVRTWKRTPTGTVEVLENLTALGYAGTSAANDDGALFPEHCTCAACAALMR